MQPDHSKEDTLALLVYGWPCKATFPGKEAKKKLADLTAALVGTEAVFVVAQSLVYVDGKMDMVVGIPVASAHANDGPKAFRFEDVRAVERRIGEVMSPALKAKIDPHLDETWSGPPKWLLVPTGALASGYCAYGELVETPEERDATVTSGCDMNQDSHEKAVRGARLATASDWDIEEIDLSEARCADLTKQLPKGQPFVIARYD
jgi:hypothetical protein